MITAEDIADYMEQHGHAVGEYRDASTGAVCVIGACYELIKDTYEEWDVLLGRLNRLAWDSGFTSIAHWSDETPTPHLLKQLRGQT